MINHWMRQCVDHLILKSEWIAKFTLKLMGNYVILLRLWPPNQKWYQNFKNWFWNQEMYKIMITYKILIRAPKGSPALRESRGTRGNPAGTGGSGIKNFKCRTGRDSRKENAFPQNSRNSRTVKILSHWHRI
jgi:hypothetical protein